MDLKTNSESPQRLRHRLLYPRCDRAVPSALLPARHHANVPIRRTRTGAHTGRDIDLPRFPGGGHSDIHPVHRWPLFAQKAFHDVDIGEEEALGYIQVEGQTVGAELRYSGSAAVAGHGVCYHADLEECLRQTQAGPDRSVQTIGHYGSYASHSVRLLHMYRRQGTIEGWLSLVAVW